MIMVEQLASTMQNCKQIKVFSILYFMASLI